MKVRVIRHRDKKVVEEDVGCENYCLEKDEQDRRQQLETLRTYHEKLTELREEEARLKASIQALSTKYHKMLKVINGITTHQLWQYCSRLQDTAKGKYDDK